MKNLINEKLNLLNQSNLSNSERFLNFCFLVCLLKSNLNNMVRNAINRSNKYGAKIDGDIIGQRYDATKKMAVEQQKIYFAKAEKLETQVKIIIDGAPSMLQHFYIAFAEEFSTKRIDSERSICFTKWAMRGLDWWYLLRIANELYGGVPELQGTGVLPPTAGYYSFHSGQGNIAYDLSGNDNHGAITNATWTTGKIGNCLDYNGINAKVTSKVISAITKNGTYTVLTWIKPSLVIANETIIWANALAVDDRNGLMISSNSTSLRFGYYDGVDYTSASGDIVHEKWNHVACVNNGGIVSLYIDGILQTGVLNPSLGGDVNFHIGSRDGISKWFEGKIDEDIVYDRALSEAEIKQYYNLTK